MIVMKNAKIWYYVFIYTLNPHGPMTTFRGSAKKLILGPQGVDQNTPLVRLEIYNKKNQCRVNRPKHKGSTTRKSLGNCDWMIKCCIYIGSHNILRNFATFLKKRTVSKRKKMFFNYDSELYSKIAILIRRHK